MKILVLGGTGLIGKAVSRKLTGAGHEVVIGSPSNGIDVVTGEGLAEALEATEVVIDLSNAASPDEQTALHFFRTAGKNLAALEKTAGVKHHVVLSIVGTDRATYIGYLQAKKDQEDYIKNSGIPYTVIRSTQFHEHMTTLIDVQGDETGVNISTVDYQPIAASDVVDFVVQIALEDPRNGTVEIAGPERARMTDFVQKYLDHTDDSKVLISNDENQYMFFEIPGDLLVPLGEFRRGRITFDDWLKAN
ncbi:NmrA family transcriptional regulator [Pedobacter yulinensis]|uniref:NmrA family transcriptional regulator n=1 Tax=Pedobacter yulinensis TaxID=2126353 RepID=A0A2T3HL68_9SPHI|nr:SDR family oxidoreductase [Pedobacter yulinensis]PST83174.1 NmrA family transcriptional regulator [Pedobacter yulinensis]